MTLNLKDMTPEQIMAEFAKLQAKVSKAEAMAKARIKVLFNEEKGTISVVGLGRFPTSLYASQWQQLLDQKETILQCIDDNSVRIAELEKAHAEGKQTTGKAVG